MTKKIVTLSGDGIGPEIINAGLQVLSAVAEKIGFDYELDAKDFGGAAIDKFGVPLPDETLEAARNADAILHAAIGDPKFDGAEIRPEQGLLKSRQLRARVVTARMTIYLILMAFGAIEIFQYVEKSGLTIGFLGNLLIYSLVLPPIFGWLRVLTYTYLVNDDQQVMRKGNLLTAFFLDYLYGFALGTRSFHKSARQSLFAL